MIIPAARGNATALVALPNRLRAARSEPHIDLAPNLARRGLLEFIDVYLKVRGGYPLKGRHPPAAPLALADALPDEILEQLGLSDEVVASMPRMAL